MCASSLAFSRGCADWLLCCRAATLCSLLRGGRAGWSGCDCCAVLVDCALWVSGCCCNGFGTEVAPHVVGGWWLVAEGGVGFGVRGGWGVAVWLKVVASSEVACFLASNTMLDVVARP